MRAAEAVSVLNLKNGYDDDVVNNGSLLENVVAGIGAWAMDSDSPDVKTSNKNNTDDVHCCHPAGPLFWVQMLESNIPMPLLPDPLDMSMALRNFVSHYTCVWQRQCWRGGGGGGQQQVILIRWQQEIGPRHQK
jgi:hypothetical protein